jgi:photosystem II stability/assembly factor-like uncharacterized protein
LNKIFITISVRRFFIITLLFMAGSDLFAVDHWLTLQRPTTRNLRAMYFEDSLKGWIGGDSGLILKTTNGGQNWTQQPTGLNTTVYSIFFTDASTGYALAWELDNTPPNFYGTRYLYTTNGGTVWNNYLFPDSNYFANTVYYRDQQNGYLGGTQGKIYFTTDAGQVWNLSSIDSGLVFGFPVEEIKFFNANSGYAVGGAFDIAGIIWRTSNGGRSWQTRIVGPEPVNDIHIIDENNAIGAGGDFEYGSSKVVTSNSGFDWNYEEFGVFGIANSIAFRNPQEGWISLGIIDSFLVTTDSGSSWRMSAVPQQGRIYKIVFSDQRNGWAIGNDGILLKYNSSIIGISNDYSSIPSEFELYQNYPNPFNPTTSIKYKLQRAGYISLKVYDILGHEVKTLVNRKHSPGNYEIDFNGDELASGIYVYKLAVDGKNVSAKRMVLLK